MGSLALEQDLQLTTLDDIFCFVGVKNTYRWPVVVFVWANVCYSFSASRNIFFSFCLPTVSNFSLVFV